MKRIRFTWAQIAERSNARPAGYVGELHAIAVEQTDVGLVFDVESEGFRALVAKYRPKPRPNLGTIPDDYDPETSASSPKRGSCCDAPKRARG